MTARKSHSKMPIPRPWVVGDPIQGAKPVTNQLFGTLCPSKIWGQFRRVLTNQVFHGFSFFQRRLPSAELNTYGYILACSVLHLISFVCLLAGPLALEYLCIQSYLGILLSCWLAHLGWTKVRKGTLRVILYLSKYKMYVWSQIVSEFVNSSVGSSIRQWVRQFLAGFVSSSVCQWVRQLQWVCQFVNGFVNSSMGSSMR